MPQIYMVCLANHSTVCYRLRRACVREPGRTSRGEDIQLLLCQRTQSILCYTSMFYSGIFEFISGTALPWASEVLLFETRGGM